MLSSRKWGSKRAVHLIGNSPSFLQAQERLARFAGVDGHVLLTGESGVGKELFARSLYLHCERQDQPFLSINCAQYQSGDLLVSELFGHRKGSFTGALSDQEGLFEAADGGVVFLDEVGELSPEAQAMLLRTLGEGEVKRLGETEARFVNVRVVAATNRPIEKMVAEKTFRTDLFYRLRYLHIQIPPLRDRGSDGQLIASFFLKKLNRKYGERKQFSEAARQVLGRYHWPGNIRELRSIVEMAYCLSSSALIEPEDFADGLKQTRGGAPSGPSTAVPAAQNCYHRMIQEGRDFWNVVRKPFMDRELNRRQVRAIVRRGLSESGGSYKKLLGIFRVQQDDYLKFMDFLRHHRLKPKKKSELAVSSSSRETAHQST